ncbi:zinc finger CCCH domain-containing protein 15 [Cyclospora cayetanensis]|uniref:Zinc finger CCCH domain-containing protein 15 n=1 Tax=Cyclospora cayetanensis TaxID=88456 RepID=A0A6P6RQW3_9EIME|nr:zinc finger CCCH domain-containing protein 15 [Cyclospora cayetanensis]
MPPAKKKDAKSERGQQKALEKEKQKVIEDKTFGLKNKNKSKAVQKFIKSVQQSVKGPQKGGEAQEIAKKKEEQQLKKAQLQQQLLLQALFKGTENVKKVASETTVGTYDPKESKLEQKIDLYIDQREQNGYVRPGGGGGEDVDTETAIVCKYFLEAVERKQYGWFWVCPNGGDACKYRHCLPQGYVLKGEGEELVAEEEEEPIEEKVERERQALPPGGTPVTAETFAAWKARKEAERLSELEQQQKDAKKAAKGAAGTGPLLSGKDLFSFNPSLFVDSEGAADERDYEEDLDWAEEMRRNQETLDEANAAARVVALQEDGKDAEEGGSSGGKESLKRQEQETDGEGVQSEPKAKAEKDAQPIKAELFVEDLTPEELEALDD